MKKVTAAGLVAVGALVTGVVLGSGPGVPAAPDVRAAAARPSVDPADFAHPRPNPYYPLRPGQLTRLRGSDEDGHYRERVHVTGRTKMIEGVRTTVVTDVLHRRNGSLAERTTDWYAADNQGNVWYFGENTATYDEKGHLESREGTWMAGRDGARPGLIMPAHPRPTDAYRQEFLRGHAEDQAWIVANQVRVRVPAGSYRRVVRSFEWTRLEPGVVSLKFYAPGVGIVAERDVSGGHEKFVLVSVRPGR